MTSVNELARDGHKVSRRNMMNPAEEPEVPYVTKCLAPSEDPSSPRLITSVRIPTRLESLCPAALRSSALMVSGEVTLARRLRGFFEVDRRYVVLAAMTALAHEGAVSRADVANVMTDLGIDPAKPDPTTI